MRETRTTMERLSKLNPAQRQAVLTTSGPLLILAGAGTGKTRVITYRIVELIRSGIPADRILSVTFTNKAAREMRERTTALLGRRCKAKPLICTFHAFCVRVLRQDISVLGYPPRFAIYDRSDQESVARSALREIRVGDKSLRPSDLLNTISRWKMGNVTPEQATDFVNNDLEFLAAVAYRKYQAKLRTCGAVDFDDLLMLTNQLFHDHPDRLKRHQAHFDHVQIDEYQDTNAAQFHLADALVKLHGNLCVVGDDDQSIYGWRGADVRHILNFQHSFPKAIVIRLETNYRCTDKILEVANRLVQHNSGRHKKTLVAKRQSKAPVRFLEFEDETAEARGIVAEIHHLIDRQQVPPEDVAILFRTNEQPRLFETELRRLKLRYTLVGSQSFFDRKETRDVLAYLKVLAFPSDELSLLRIINTPARGIGATTIKTVMEWAVAQKRSLWEAATHLADSGSLPRKAARALEAFRQLLETFRRRLNETPGQMAEIVRELISSIGYKQEIEKQYKDPNQQTLRWNMIEQLVDATALYVEGASEATLEGFLEEIALLGRDEEPDQDDQLADQTVKLMTLHSAKGLEFPRVYMVGLEEGLLPHHRSVQGDGTAIEEERRLAYVGLTRAQNHLTLSRAASRMKWGRRRIASPSRFLFEMRGEMSLDEFADDLEDDSLDRELGQFHL